jgi:transcriptional regulator with PAS, ATPase and Fis domain
MVILQKKYFNEKIGIIIPNINNYIMNNIICESEHMILNRQIIQRVATSDASLVVKVI